MLMPNCIPKLRSNWNASRIGLLSDQQNQDHIRIQELRTELRNKAQEFGTVRLDTFFENAAMRVTKLEGALSDIQLAMLSGPTTQAAGPPSTRQAAAAAEQLTPDFIALSDGAMRVYLDQVELRQQELSRLQRSYPDTHPSVVAAKDNLDKAKQRVVKHQELYLAYRAATAEGLGDGRGPVATAGMTPEQLKANADTLQKVLVGARADMVSVGLKQYDIEQQEAELASLQGDESDLDKRMDTLRTEGALGGRLNVISAGEVPLSPVLDRRMKLAAAAGMFGLVMPAALAILASFMLRRYRYADETIRDSSLNNVPLLGMLPEVGRKPDAEVMHATAHGIHQMRVLLCANTPREERRSYLITSATEGEGKTNLTVALGMSYATAKRRTLVIDCDFVGRRLTQGFKAEGTEGLYEAMQEGQIGNRLRQESPLLYILPTGKVASTDASGVTAEAILARFWRRRASNLTRC